ncbi:hypothetical protein [Desulfovibrio litoralis]|uniref:Uncharacterized protein n=1 Tax=Desulfovibrio litoralis DSM 11393 TaxID=1121455 RepID=A0A1M7TI02_9BACT|nr:hypothetical protein [Desulfovibrio litoralis]SHN70336.1 hypothetical protein SAMN02745728_02030 [Desulfovibrio litoralis DSM 11393]
MQTQNKDPHICELCSNTALSCCRSSGKQLEFRFPLSLPEFERIQKFIEKNKTRVPELAEAFYDEIINDKSFVTALADLFPKQKQSVAKLYETNKTRKVLKVVPANITQDNKTKKVFKCVFLGETGCLLEREVRPFHCLLYPLWTFETQTEVLNDPDCLVFKKAKALSMNKDEQVNFVLSTLNIDLKVHLALFQALKKDWGL